MPGARNTKESYDDVTTTIADSPSHPPIGVVVRIFGAPSSPRELHLKQGSCTIGSGPASDLVVTDRTISRMHVELTLAPEGVAVRDRGSRNGTYYLGQRVESMVLGVGGRILLGDHVTVGIEPDEQALHAGAPFRGDEYRGLIGVSNAMHELFGVLERIEGSLVTVLLEGESGAGKDGVARAIHAGSRVSQGPFVPVNCGAIARELVASELFGHRRGAFSGAVEARRGAFEAANGGTLLLDELGELPLEVQPMLLRALETGEVRAVGDDQARLMKVRLIAATNRDLEARVKEGLFREDLFYRLAVVRLKVPPLRERPDDIAPLATLFARAEGLEALPKQVVDELRTRSFPGNVRELRNVVQAYVALGRLPPASAKGEDVRRLTLKHLVNLDRPFLEQRDEIVDDFTRLYLDALLSHTNGNQSVAAQIAGLDRTYLGRLLSKLRK